MGPLAIALMDFINASHLPASAVTVLPTDFLDRLPLIHVRMAGGTQRDGDRLSRVTIDVYAAAPHTPTALSAAALAEEVLELLGEGPVFLGPRGLIDEVSVESIPVARPFSDRVDVASASVALIHRPVYS